VLDLHSTTQIVSRLHASDSFRKKLRRVYKSVLKVCYANVLDCAVYEIIWAWYKVKLCMVNKRVTDKNVLKSFSTSGNMPICIDNYFLFLTRVIYSRNQQVESETTSLRVKSFGAVDSNSSHFRIRIKSSCKLRLKSESTPRFVTTQESTFLICEAK
jgi:hypothetical protein